METKPPLPVEQVAPISYNHLAEILNVALGVAKAPGAPHAENPSTWEDGAEWAIRFIACNFHISLERTE